jgi:hypothetical protein
VAGDAPDPLPGTPLPPPAKHSRITRARELVDVRWNQLVASRQRMGSVDVAFQVFESDRAKGGGIMAGAVAFRMFVALVPATLVVIIVFGTIAHLTGEAAQDVARQAGITGLAAATIKTAADASTTSTIVTLALAMLALFLASNSLAKTLRVAHFLLWDMPPRPLKRSWRAGLTVIGLLGALSAITLVIARARLASGRRRGAPRGDRVLRVAEGADLVSPLRRPGCRRSHPGLALLDRASDCGVNGPERCDLAPQPEGAAAATSAPTALTLGSIGGPTAMPQRG